MSITIFYSWQSDVNENHNRKFIKLAMEEAITRLKSDDSELDVVIDQATKNTAGSPHIRDTILNKIRNADIFVADATAIFNSNLNQDGLPKFHSNSNVMMELGYAIAYLGWEWIILVCNTAYGAIENLPFDVRGHRGLIYNLNEDNQNNIRSVKGNLIQTFKEGIKLIKDQMPIKPKFTDHDLIKRDRDLSQLEEVINVLDIPEIEQYLNTSGDVLFDKYFLNFDNIYNVFNRPLS